MLNEDLINRIKVWRDKNKNCFFSVFEVTAIGTKIWLETAFLRSNKKVLFLVEDTHGQVVGHIGLSKINYQKGEAEIDSVLKGENCKLYGFFKVVCMSLLKWAKETISLRYVYLFVFVR